MKYEQQLFRYTLCFALYEDKALFVQRVKWPYVGLLNGLGGKIDFDRETPAQGVVREMKEEADIDLTVGVNLVFRGLVTWGKDERVDGGMYVYRAHVGKECYFENVKHTPEGVLCWVGWDQIVTSNPGVATNMPYFFPAVVDDRPVFRAHCVFDHERLERVDMTDLGDEVSLEGIVI